MTSTFQDAKSFKLQDCKKSRFQDFKNSKFQDFKMPSLQNFKKSKVRNFKISKVQSFKISRLQNFKIVQSVARSSFPSCLNWTVHLLGSIPFGKGCIRQASTSTVIQDVDLTCLWLHLMSARSLRVPKSADLSSTKATLLEISEYLPPGVVCYWVLDIGCRIRSW